MRCALPALALMLLVAGCHTEAPRPPSRFHELASARRIEGLSRSQRRGKAIYDHYCAVCHGAEGRGDGFNAYNLRSSLDVAPADLTRQDGALTAEERFRVIAGGGAASGRSVYMPPWGGTLDPTQIHDVVDYVGALAAAATGDSAATESSAGSQE